MSNDPFMTCMHQIGNWAFLFFIMTMIATCVVWLIILFITKRISPYSNNDPDGALHVNFSKDAILYVMENTIILLMMQFMYSIIESIFRSARPDMNYTNERDIYMLFVISLFSILIFVIRICKSIKNTNADQK